MIGSGLDQRVAVPVQRDQPDLQGQPGDGGSGGRFNLDSGIAPNAPPLTGVFGAVGTIEPYTNRRVAAEPRAEAAMTERQALAGPALAASDPVQLRTCRARERSGRPLPCARAVDQRGRVIGGSRISTLNFIHSILLRFSLSRDPVIHRRPIPAGAVPSFASASSYFLFGHE